MYERHHEPLLSQKQFLVRLFKHMVLAVLLVVGSLGMGMLGYVWFEELLWVDAFLHSAILLGGMGLAAVPLTEEAKIFVGLYALYSGMVFVAAMGIIVAPVLHRILHLFHLRD